MIMFTAKDIEQIRAKGATLDRVESQMEYFRKGFPFLPINRAAVVGDGIVRLPQGRVAQLSDSYDIALECGVDVLKFVPASGAATRMFKELYEFVEMGKTGEAVDVVCERIGEFAFYGDLLGLGVDFSDKRAVVSAILEQGLGYGALPKALLKFHRYGVIARTALEEHLVEAALYGKGVWSEFDAAQRAAESNSSGVMGDKNGDKSSSSGISDRSGGSTSGKATRALARIHFTVSPEHMDGFKAMVERCRAHYQRLYGVSYQITYSVQKSATDTIAVSLDDEPFREKDGSLLFRPAGHGALIDNLNELRADLVFIKTIDNVVPDGQKADTVRYKKALGAMVLGLRAQIFEYIAQIDRGEASGEEIITFLDNNIGCRLSGATSFEELRAVLDRPLRVCGMVLNQGEPGGGPFWVDDAGGGQSLQIAESSQISPAQKSLMSSATHFNPVDLVCSTRRHDGTYFDLRDYVDPQTGFISQKSKDGRELKAQELPGLWNGAMANWNTVFVEVPITTFAPVKTVLDLLRVEHQ